MSSARRHAAPPAARAGRRRTRGGRRRLAVVLLAPLVVLLPVAAWASVRPSSTPTRTVLRPLQTAAASPARLVWSRTWQPPLALLSSYRKCCRTKAGFKALPLSYHVLAAQGAVATATFRTDWVDVKARYDGPNISQQGLSIQPQQFKLQIAHGPTPASHRGNCRIAGATGQVLAYGPKIDVADGRWHTITCIKSPDTSQGTKVVVVVDGVAGAAKWSKRPIGDVSPTGKIRLGGRSALASSDSLDGYIKALSFSVVG